MYSLECTPLTRTDSLSVAKPDLQNDLEVEHTESLQPLSQIRIVTHFRIVIPKKITDPFVALPPTIGPKAVSTVTLAGLPANSSCRCAPPDIKRDSAGVENLISKV